MKDTPRTPNPGHAAALAAAQVEGLEVDARPAPQEAEPWEADLEAVTREVNRRRNEEYAALGWGYPRQLTGADVAHVLRVWTERERKRNATHIG